MTHEIRAPDSIRSSVQNPQEMTDAIFQIEAVRIYPYFNGKQGFPRDSTTQPSSLSRFKLESLVREGFMGSVEKVSFASFR